MSKTKTFVCGEDKTMKNCCKECIAKIPDDEPVFCLFGRDVLASWTILEWIKLGIDQGISIDKLLEGMRHLKDIVDFQKANPERVHLPD
jgi:hypothetical protein